jgi:hypothetical protein
MKDKKIEDIFKSTFEKHSIQPSDKVWDSIRLQTASKKKTPIFAYAAAASIAIIIGMFFLLNTKEGMNSNINKTPSVAIEKEPVSQENLVSSQSENVVLPKEIISSNIDSKVPKANDFAANIPKSQANNFIANQPKSEKTEVVKNIISTQATNEPIVLVSNIQNENREIFTLNPLTNSFNLINVSRQKESVNQNSISNLETKVKPNRSLNIIVKTKWYQEEPDSNFSERMVSLGENSLKSFYRKDVKPKIKDILAFRGVED